MSSNTKLREGKKFSIGKEGPRWKEELVIGITDVKAQYTVQMLLGDRCDGGNMQSSFLIDFIFSVK